ncbi:MAG: GHKL domain-containing protein [Saprospiraceae bacterium]|nr:GHKL domain-containing protein [Saprospiraceae bacterium]
MKLIDTYLAPWIHPRLKATPYAYRDFKAAMTGITAAGLATLLQLANFLLDNFSGGIILAAIPLGLLLALSFIIIRTGYIKVPIFVGVFLTSSTVAYYMWENGGLYLKSIYWILLPIGLLVLIRSIRLALLLIGLTILFLLGLYIGDYSNFDLFLNNALQEAKSVPLVSNIAYTVALFGLMYAFHLNSSLSLQLYQNEVNQRDQRNRALQEILNEIETKQQQLVASQNMATLGQLTSGIGQEFEAPVSDMALQVEHLQRQYQNLNPCLQDLQQLINTTPAVELQPLYQAIQGADLLFLQKEIPQLLETMERASDRLQQTMEGIKTFTQKRTENWEEADITELIRKAITSKKEKLLRSDIHLVQAHAPLPLWTCQPGRICQLLAHILDNAIEAMPDGGELKIRTQLENEHWILMVEDSGSGIDPQIHAQLFDPFFTTKEVGAGKGLGLAISYSIVQQHSGQITIDSKMQEGTTVRLNFPVNSLAS